MFKSFFQQPNQSKQNKTILTEILIQPELGTTSAKAVYSYKTCVKHYANLSLIMSKYNFRYCVNISSNIV